MEKSIKESLLKRVRKAEAENTALKLENSELKTIVEEQADALIELADIITEEV